MPVFHYENELQEEHRSRALLIKLGWMLIAGLCSVFIAILWWSETERIAHWAAKIGISFWLLSGVAAIVAVNAWIRERPGIADIATGTDLLLLALTALWLLLLIISRIQSHTLWSMPFAIDGLTWLCAVGLLVLINENRPLHKVLKITRVGAPVSGLKVFKIAQLGWALSGLTLFIAASLWFKNSNAGASAGFTLGLAILASFISVQCYQLLAEIYAVLGQSEKGEPLKFNARSRLNVLKLSVRKINSVAWVLFAFFVCSLLVSAKISQGGASVSTTVVTAMLGLVASAASARISGEPIFPDDKLRVFGSTAGTQYIFPVELLLLQDTASEMEAIRDSVRIDNRKKD